MLNEESENKNLKSIKTTDFFIDKSEYFKSLNNSLFFLSKSPILDSISRVQNMIEPYNKIHHITNKMDKYEQLINTNNTDSFLPSNTSKFLDNIEKIKETYSASNTIWKTTLDSHKQLIFPFKATNDFSSKFTTPFYSNLLNQTNVNKILKFSEFAEKSFISINQQNLGSRINLEKSNKTTLNSTLLDYTSSYSKLMCQVSKNPSTYSELDSTISKIAPIEYFSTANLIKSISVEEESTIEEELLKSEIVYENEISLTNYLPKIHPDLYLMWQGAIQAYHSENPDKIRHFTTSIRELFTHVLHFLAPDVEIKNWTVDPSNFHSGKPTRKSRIQYILRNINSQTFDTFIKKDIDAIIAFIDIFQSGTHKIKSDFSEGQLIAFKSKAESTLKFLLEIHFKTNR